ncbi:hypothetical protein [Methanobrevibacter ruminantium]|uniref:hypothetical protein n=2 Tax=Methanobrevibacter ruminantium TaxID=83816 RepID=UPI0026EAB6C1|nr:hypothetical protein [Methanobrevibacter ruminantium]
MVNLNEQILLTIAARDNASNVAKNIDSSFQGMASNLSKSMSSISNSMMNFSAVSNNALQGLTGKSALDNIFGTTSKNETNQVLLKNMMDDFENHYDAFYDKVDKTTDNSIVSMQELIPALKAFKSATGATDEEMTNVTEGITNFGAAVLAQTGSTDLAQQAMMDLSKGAKGAFASLDQYGISEDALMRTGLWSGKEEDVEGYIKAVTEVTGSTEELMQTNQGLDALIGKSFSRAGKKIGNEFLPQLKDVKRAFIDLDNETGGALAGSILATGGAIEVMNQGLWNVSTTVQGIKDLKEGFVAVKDAASGAASMIKSFGKTTETVTVTAESLGAAASHANGGFSLLPANFDINSLKKEADIVEDVVEESTAVGALAPGAAAASAEVEVTSGAMAGLSASFTSMIVPLLSLAAVIAVMIPIAVALAAEALLGLKAIQLVFDALNFDDIDLSKSVDSIKKLAEGIAWVGLAMGAMSFAGLMTGLTYITGGFLGMTAPLQLATDTLTEAASILQQFSAVSIDDSIPKNLQNIGKSLNSVSDAMMALTSTNITTGFSDFVAWALGFGSVTDGLEQAKNDIISASSKLQEFKVLKPLDDTTANNIQNVCDSLASVGKAMEALRSVRDGVNWDGFLGNLFGGVDIQTALTNVKQDIVKASQALKQFTGLEEVPKDVGTKIKSVSDALTSVSDAFQSLRKLRDDTNWDSFMDLGGADIATAITNIGNDLRMVSVRLASLSTIANVNEDVTEKITKINTALGKVSEVVKSMTNVPTMEGFSSETITTAVTNVRNAATELSKLSGITLGEDSTGILGTIQTAMESLKNTLSSASGFSAPSMSIGSQIVNGVKSGLSPLTGTVQGAITSATSSAASSGWTGGAYIGTSTTNGMNSALKLKETMSTELGYTLSAITDKRQEFYNAGVDLGKAVKEGFESQSAINPGSPGNLAHTMMDEVAYIKEAMTSKYGVMKATGARLGNSILTGFGNPSLGLGLDNSISDFTSSQMGSLQTILSQVPGNGAYSNVTIIVGEGAVNVDARNKTEREAQQIMITALESLDSITDIRVTGA